MYLKERKIFQFSGIIFIEIDKPMRVIIFILKKKEGKMAVYFS